MTQLYAQPYDLSATGFYFETADDYTAKANPCATTMASLSKSLKSSSLMAMTLTVSWQGRLA